MGHWGGNQLLLVINVETCSCKRYKKPFDIVFISSHTGPRLFQVNSVFFLTTWPAIWDRWNYASDGEKFYNHTEIVSVTCLNILKMGVQMGVMKSLGRILKLGQCHAWWCLESYINVNPSINQSINRLIEMFFSSGKDTHDNLSMAHSQAQLWSNHITGLILGLCPANERPRYFVTKISHWLGASLESALYQLMDQGWSSGKIAWADSIKRC